MSARPALLALALSACACPRGEPVRVESADGALDLCAEIARTEEARRAGLRGRAPLAPGEGLLLAFSVEDEICIVNDGVSFAIDALFAGSAGSVIAIERGIESGDSTPRCHGPAQWVLETAAGELGGVREGDLVVVPAAALP